MVPSWSKAKKSETKTADSKKENEKSSTTAPISSGIAATTSKVEDDIAIITDICARGVGATGSKCTPWGILRSSKYKNKKITQEMIDAFIRDEVTKEQEKLIKKEKLRRAVVKTLGEDFEVSSSESADTGQGSGSSGEGEDTDEEKDKKTKDKKKKEKEKKEKEKKEKEKKEKEKKKRQKMPKGCRIAGIKNREEIMRDT
ncbi:DNA ligase 1-like [Hyposmocoma kahamanoa]|uniref:DNA ligase 1-like n=1 Tax=Hyposmocoma kahamanoa TaxID=1477025 RepID=UPI000E6D99A3|nr:DNA ligase 1-like [Hyposmocoma kahamanoa]